jgi:hypothetical protein
LPLTCSFEIIEEKVELELQELEQQAAGSVSRQVLGTMVLRCVGMKKKRRKKKSTAYMDVNHMQPGIGGRHLARSMPDEACNFVSIPFERGTQLRLRPVDFYPHQELAAVRLDALRCEAILGVYPPTYEYADERSLGT